MYCNAIKLVDLKNHTTKRNVCTTRLVLKGKMKVWILPLPKQETGNVFQNNVR